MQKLSCSHVPSFILMWLFCFTKHIDANETTVEGTVSQLVITGNGRCLHNMDELSELIKDETGERGLIECLCRVTDPGNLLGVTQLSFFLLFM